MITIDISDILAMISEEEIAKDLQAQAEDMINAIYVDLTAPPPLGTPVKSGAARNSWQIDNSDPMAPEVYSDSPYMGKLNDGSSKQSPSGFIEAIVDKHTS